MFQLEDISKRILYRSRTPSLCTYAEPSRGQRPAAQSGTTAQVHVGTNASSRHLSLSRQATPTDQPPRHASLWRIVKMLIHSLRAAIIGVVPLDTCYARLNIAGYRLNEPPRRRTPQMVQPLS